jgi:hypothetical protein
MGMFGDVVTVEYETWGRGAYDLPVPRQLHH